MIKCVKKVLVASLFVGVSLSSATLEEMNQNIANTGSPEKKQMLLCEREASYIFKNPQECIEAASIPKDKAYYSPYETYEKYLAAMLSNAGLVYDKLNQHEMEMKMYNKGLEYNPSDPGTHTGIGVLYYLGSGVEMNKYKAYDHWTIAAKQGNATAQKNLDILCRESPWACK